MRSFVPQGVACKEEGDEWEFLGLLPMLVSPLPSTILVPVALLNMQVRPASFRHGRNDC